MSYWSGATGVYAAGESHVACLPRGWRPGSGRRGVLYFHGALQSAKDCFGAGTAYLLPDAGYPMLAVDAGGPSAWGNDTAIARATDAWSYLKGAAIGAAGDKCYVVGISMGGLTACNWIRQNRAVVAGAWLAIPALDPNDVYQNNKGPGSYRADIAAAYGVVYPAALPAGATHQPVLFPADLAGVPLKVWSSDDDPIASATAQVTGWAAAIGATAHAASMGAVGHTINGLDVQDAVRFFDANGGRG